MMRPLDLSPYRVINPGKALAQIGIDRRKAKSRAFHREMREHLGLPSVPEWEASLPE